MTELLPFLARGLVLGIGAGAAPGPLTLLLVSETLKHGPRAGMKAAFAPLITDAPIVLIALLVLMPLRDIGPVIAGISFAGALILVKLGISGLRFQGLGPATEEKPARSLRKAVAVNFFNPHPWMFWAAIGGPLILQAGGTSLAAAAGFLILFYAMMVMTKLVMASVTGFSRGLLRSRGYIWLNRLMGALLLLFACWFIRDGLEAVHLI
jgi:threonine/homoserine/homoserine lactone efflux protein